MKPITRDTIDRVIERLRRNEMQAHYFPEAAEAKEEVLTTLGDKRVRGHSRGGGAWLLKQGWIGLSSRFAVE